MASGVTVTVQGAEKLDRLGRALKDAGDKDLRRELMKAMQRSGRPLKAAARAGALAKLPRRGGLAERVAGSRFSVRTSASGKNVGVRVVATSKDNVRRMDRGQIRHPVYADPSKPRADWAWVTQQIEPGWFTESEQEAAPAVRHELLKGIDAVAAKLKASA